MNKVTNAIAELFAKARKNIAYKVEGAIIDFTEDLCKLMTAQGINKAELAKRLGCKPAYITKLLSGNNNFTIETMVKAADALGADVRVHLQPAGLQSHWIDAEAFQVTNTTPQPAAIPTATVDFSKARAVAAPHNPMQSFCAAANEELALAA